MSGLRFRWSLLVACGLLLVPASAQAVTIDGDQLDIYLDGQGNVQVLALGQSSYSFYQPGTQAGDAGFFVGVKSGGPTYGPPLVAGPTEAAYEPVGQEGVTGSGSAGSPFEQVTTYKASTTAEIKQTTIHVDGQRSFRQRFELTNTSGSSLSYRASVAADLYLEGSDDGVGYFSLGPPRIVGGLSEATGRAGGLREVPGSPWSAYQEAYYYDIWTNVFSPGGAGLENSIVAGLIDNGIGVQWDGSPLANGAKAIYEIEWQFGLAGLVASPPSALLGTGSFHQVTVTATDSNGGLISGGVVRYQITGANPSSGFAITAGNGQAQIGWVGKNAGTDTLSAYLDLDNNNVHDVGEPDAAANAIFVDPVVGPPTGKPTPGAPPPVLQGRPILQNGVTTLVVVVPSAGRLHVEQAPAGGKKARASASRSRKGKGKKKGKRKKRILIRKVNLNVKKAGRVRVKIKPTKLGKKILAKRGKFKVKIRISFTPKGSKKTQSISRNVIVKKKKHRKKGRGGKRH